MILWYVVFDLILDAVIKLLRETLKGLLNPLEIHIVQSAVQTLICVMDNFVSEVARFKKSLRCSTLFMAFQQLHDFIVVIEYNAAHFAICE